MGVFMVHLLCSWIILLPGCCLYFALSLLSDRLCLVCSKKGEMHRLHKTHLSFRVCLSLFLPPIAGWAEDKLQSHIVLRITPCLHTTEALFLGQMVISGSQGIKRRRTLVNSLVWGLPTSPQTFLEISEPQQWDPCCTFNFLSKYLCLLYSGVLKMSLSLSMLLSVWPFS